MALVTVPARIVISKDDDGEVNCILGVIDEPGAGGPATLVQSTARNAPCMYHGSRNWGLTFVEELERTGVLAREHGIVGPSIMPAIPGIPKFMNGQENDKGLHVSIYNKPAPGKGAGKGAPLDYSKTGGPIHADTHSTEIAALDGKVIQISLRMDSIKLLTGGPTNDMFVGCPFYVAVSVAEETQQLISTERALLGVPSAGFEGHLSVAGLAPSWAAHPLAGSPEVKATEEDFAVFRDGDNDKFAGWHTEAWRAYFVAPKGPPTTEKALVAPSLESQEALVAKRKQP